MAEKPGEVEGKIISDNSETSKWSGVRIRTRQLGVYELLEEVSPWEILPWYNVWKAVSTFVEDWPFLKRFIVECVCLDPRMIFIWAVATLISSLLPAVALYFSGRLLSVIQETLEQTATNFVPFYIIAGSLLLCRILENQLSYFSMISKRAIQRRTTFHFGEYLLRVNLRLDVPTWLDTTVQAKLRQISPKYNVDQGWRVMEGSVNVISAVIEVMSHLLILLSFMREEKGGFMFALIACIRPLLDFTSESKYPSVFYVYLSNWAYKRMEKMVGLAENSDYRKAIIGDGLQEYIHEEYKRSVAAVGDLSTERPWEQMSQTSNMIRSLISHASQDLPMILFALQSIRAPGIVPLKSLTLLGTSIQGFSYSLSGLKWHLREVRDFRTVIRAFYEAVDIENLLKDGDLSYPPPEAPVPGGMKVEFQNVTFKYPNKDVTVLKDMSFTIQPGQLCVIVGENGCGKSSTVKLLSRIFDASEGTVLVDDHPIQDYAANEVRRAEAILYQDFIKYPLTVRENIGLGDVEHINDIDKIHRAAKLGGAYDFIQALPTGFESEISPTRPTYSSLSRAKVDGPLKKKIKEMEQKLELSGGQWQRLAIARTFMRTEDNDAIRLLCFDEPSSALDPKAEFELFEKLRSVQGKKTLIFITHRFGHLTKYADVILYMKDGVILEQGTHAELLAKNGAYAHLYNVQAQAFSS